MKKLISITLILYGIHATYAASHSIKYFYTAVTPGTDFPEFTAVGLVDDEQFVYYDSNITTTIPKTEWMKKNVGEDYWDRESQKFLGSQQTFKANIGIAMQRFNQTQGVHTAQVMYGCEWDDETGATGGFDQQGYDGEDFVALDTKTWTYIAPRPQGEITARRWNNDGAKIENWKQYTTQICVEWLKMYVSYGKSTLERRVKPQVSLLQKDTSSPVTCHVTGFYPRAVMVTWKRDGQDLDMGVERGETVPNGDGTFQTRSHLRLKPEDWKRNTYTCTVQHKSLEDDIILPVTEENIKSNKEIKPEVSLLQKDTSSPVTCHVTGFYPRAVMVTWKRDGQDLDVDVKLGETVPNGDGTFQTRSHLHVKPEDWKRNRYTCTVQHKSLEDDIILSVTEENIKCNKDPESSVGIIIGCVVLGALLLIIAVIAVFIWRKRTSGYGKTSTADTDSANSDQPAVKA
ncbi:patr class I histocompatibility antigen, A-108 alpha chain-like isoform X2 [Conger conger]|uniref:patr class I histocompatibility antigen, A-108 alpha chain-like isoform X2 n=1 Tax=Conger conger TaxID=82655 RepID=UPI002A5AEA15|nr:patr class I histocompatibility antigen, A-108 alpha chain-like isoform X2 [Conger conger]XP_061110029.1 patr class I histocompatibility antigen, A-108 alpha chain-like isoform X2 [Conger conger]